MQTRFIEFKQDHPAIYKIIDELDNYQLVKAYFHSQPNIVKGIYLINKLNHTFEIIKGIKVKSVKDTLVYLDRKLKQEHRRQL